MRGSTILLVDNLESRKESTPTVAGSATSGTWRQFPAGMQTGLSVLTVALTDSWIRLELAATRAPTPPSPILAMVFAVQALSNAKCTTLQAPALNASTATSKTPSQTLVLLVLEGARPARISQRLDALLAKRATK